MHVNVVIPTVNRIRLLQKAVTTLQNSTHKDLSIFIVVDGNREILSAVHAMANVSVLFNAKRMDWVWCMNRALKHIETGAVVYAGDDLEFEPQCIECAVACLEKHEPTGDVLVAIKQDVVGCSTAFGLLGRKFIERFPEQSVFCPDYVHYGSDSELGRFARSIGRLYMCDEARVVHHRLKDDTYRQAKPMEAQDFAFINKRKELGLLWGREFRQLRVETQQ